MFLTHRSRQAEYTDAPDLPAEVVASNYLELARVNKLLMFAHPFQSHVVRWLGRGRCANLSILDLGAGDGSLGRELSGWAAKQGLQWRVTNVDKNPRALRLAPRGVNVIATVQSLPFADASFDLVIASQMTHHITEREDVTAHFREAWRVTRDAIYLCDIHRNPVSYVMLWVVLKVMRLSPLMLHDGLMSVKRGWRAAEWKALAREAGIPEVKVWFYFGSKLVLQARKR